MKKVFCILALLIFLLGISSCSVSPVIGTKGISYDSGAIEISNIEMTTPTPTPEQTIIEPTVSEPTDTSELTPGTHTYEIKAPLHEDMPEYRFVATGIIQEPDEWMFGYVMGLDVYDENGKSILSADFSEISEEGSKVGYHVFNEMMDTMGLHVTDVNFDGYKDVIILNTFAGAHANTWYDCWLWDTKTSSFVKSKSFSEICNPALDAENKCIYSAGGSGAAYWGGRIYQFIDGEFVLTNELDTNENGLVEKALVNGKLETIREVSFGNDQEILEKEKEYYRKNDLWRLDAPHWYWKGGHHADKWLD